MLEIKVEQPGGSLPAPAGPGERQGSRPQPALDAARILMAAGGTGGHIFPALAIAQELRERAEAAGIARRIEFVGTGRGLEARVIPAAGFRLRTVAAAGLKGIRGARRLANLLVLPQSVLETALLLREFRPQVVVGLGGYLAGPVMLEAALQDIPTVLIEPNAVPGFTNRVLAPLVRVAAVGFEEAARFYGSKARLTGHAVRKAFHCVPAKAHVPPLTLLILGGSQGAKALNQCATEALPLLVSALPDVKVIHQTGERDYNAVCGAYRSGGIHAEVYPFIEDVPQALARADLVVSRAGASSVAELAAAGKASLLVPFPGATDAHQLANARALETVKAARVLEQREMTPERLRQEIADLLGAPARLEQMERAARSLARPQAAERIAELIEGFIR
jgi:UDP-N-acetylglucosamine--N-acetylmuramyl-(pentapeptide) pyrophosphoryl-undecaprenol N-acetylglucosamine transferase